MRTCTLSIMGAEDEILTGEEAAAFLKIHVKTVRRLASEGAIPALKVGREWRFRRSDLLAAFDDVRSRENRGES